MRRRISRRHDSECRRRCNGDLHRGSVGSTRRILRTIDTGSYPSSAGTSARGLDAEQSSVRAGRRGQGQGPAGRRRGFGGESMRKGAAVGSDRRADLTSCSPRAANHFNVGTSLIFRGRRRSFLWNIVQSSGRLVRLIGRSRRPRGPEVAPTPPWTPRTFTRCGASVLFGFDGRPTSSGRVVAARGRNTARAKTRGRSSSCDSDYPDQRSTHGRRWARAERHTGGQWHGVGSTVRRVSGAGLTRPGPPGPF